MIQLHRSKARHKTEASLVPLADMLANTVGIILFILAFTVLASGGAMVMKRLPRERTDAEQTSLLFLLRPDGIYPVSDKKMAEAGGKASFGAGGDSSPTVEDDFFTFKAGYTIVKTASGTVGLASQLSVAPKAGAGVSVDRVVKGEDTAVNEVLAAHKPQDHFIYCLVEKDAINSFQLFREHVINRFKFSVGWSPHSTGDSILISGGGGGTRMAPQ